MYYKLIIVPKFTCNNIRKINVEINDYLFTEIIIFTYNIDFNLFSFEA